MTLTKQQKDNKIINCLFYPAAWNGEEYEGVIQNFLTPVSLKGVLILFPILYKVLSIKHRLRCNGANSFNGTNR